MDPEKGLAMWSKRQLRAGRHGRAAFVIVMKSPQFVISRATILSMTANYGP